MGYLYIKVIESKKVAVRSSFFINYPFIRLRIGKEKKDTNFKPGVEWWDKIYSFRDISRSSNLVLTAQARDKSIHVFGSDWLGEVRIRLEDLMDGNVHQQWFKLGRGDKNHSRSPRGYLHLAFHYFDSHPNGKRPFSVAPVETVMPFEDWLATTQSPNDNSFFSSSTTAVNPTKSQESERLRKSAPAQFNDSPTREDKRKARLSSNAKSKSTNHITESRPRSSTAPTDSRRAASDDENDSDSSYEEAEAVPTGNLIDLSLFDEPKKQNTGLVRADTGLDIFNKESPVRFSPKAATAHSTLVTSLPASAPADILERMNHDPTFDDWYNVPKDAHTSYNPKNPFLAMHDSTAPAYSVQK